MDVGAAGQWKKLPNGASYFVDPANQTGYVETLTHPKPMELPKLGNEIYPYESFKGSLDFNVNVKGPKSFNGADFEKTMAEARKDLPATVTVDAQDAGKAISALATTGVKVAIEVGVGGTPLTSDEKARQTAAAVAEGVDEVDVAVDQQALIAGDLQKVSDDLKPSVKAADGHLVKAVIDTRFLSPQAFHGIGSVLHDTGIRLIKVENNATLETIRALTEQTTLPIAIGTPVTLEEAKEYQKLFGAAHRGFRLTTDQGGALGREEDESLAARTSQQNDDLQREWITPAGVIAVEQTEVFKEKMLERITKDEAGGKPVVYISIPVRPNEIATMDENQVAKKDVVANTLKAGYDAIDPFDSDGLDYLTDHSISETAVQELLMDMKVGLFPVVVAKVDALAHGPGWKYSLGAKVEHEIAVDNNVPIWNGQGKVEPRDQSKTA